MAIEVTAKKLHVNGIVQVVGFRPPEAVSNYSGVAFVNSKGGSEI